MNLRHVVVATDQSDAGRRAVGAGIELTCRAGARVTVMRVVPLAVAPRGAGVPRATGVPRAAGVPQAAGAPSLAVAGENQSPGSADDSGGALRRLEEWLEPELSRLPAGLRVERGVAFGAPSIEISRFAEDHSADLLVLGRKQRSQLGRLMLGDTADAVARRSRIPCLFVSGPASSLSRILVALDGTPRGMVVLQSAIALAEQTGGRLRVVSVEPARPGEPEDLAATLPPMASERLRDEVHAHLVGHPLERIGWPGDGIGSDILVRRRGDVVEQILRAAAVGNADILAFGIHRGGPPGIIEAGSTARRLAHAAPCAVLTIPL